MDWNILIVFGIGIGAYLVLLGLFTLIKYLRNKRKLKKELEEDGKEQEKNGADETRFY